MKTLWYMGAKGQLLPGFIESALADTTPDGGVVCDLFAGSGAVSWAATPRWTVYANDVQRYSRIIVGALIQHGPRSAGRLVDSLDFEADLAEAFEDHKARLSRRLARPLETEDHLLAALPEGALGLYRSFLENAPSYPLDGRGTGPGWKDGRRLFTEDRIGRLRRARDENLYHLATSYYQGIYFGLRQAVELDSMRFAIDRIEGPLADRKRRHYLAALLCAASTSTSGTSHFAQPRSTRKDRELKAIATRRRISIVEAMQKNSERIAAAVDRHDFQPGNRVYCQPWEQALELAGDSIDTIYADPPYTSDNYSRFYHVLEVLTRYDFPQLLRRPNGEVSKGRYPLRDYRFQSSFCSPRSVEATFRELCSRAAGLGSNLVLSYSVPNGLLYRRMLEQHGTHRRALAGFTGVFRDHFGEVELRRRDHQHSGQGDSNRKVTELLVVCRKPRGRRP